MLECGVCNSLCFAARGSANTWKKHVAIGLFAQNFTKDSSVVTVQYLLTRHCTILSGNNIIQSSSVSLDIMFSCREQVYCTLKMTTIFLRQITMSWTALAAFISHLITSAFEKQLSYLFTYFVEQSPSLESKRFTASQGITRILWNPKANYSIHKCLPTFPILYQIDPVHAPTSNFLKNLLSSHLCLDLPSSLLPSGFPTKPWIHLSSPPYVLHAPPISFLLKDKITVYSGRSVVRHSFVKLTKYKHTSFW